MVGLKVALRTIYYICVRYQLELCKGVYRCRFGWVEGGSAFYPIIWGDDDCGGNHSTGGVVSCGSDPEVWETSQGGFDVYCYDKPAL